MTVTVISDTRENFNPSRDSDAILITASGILAGASIEVDNNLSNIAVTNYGTIFGTSDGIQNRGNMQIFNGISGQIIGGGFGVRMLSGGNSRITNQGAISGGFGEGVHIEQAGTATQNQGTISGALGMYLNVENGTGTVVNAGTIAGDTTAFYKEGGGTSSFRNTGEILGNVSFADGTNVFDGRGGSVSGAVTGGSGVDTIKAGDDGETIGGGGGHDRLFAGAGADTFQFASFSSADFDYLRGFDVAKDTIELASSVFTRLAPDTTPAFSIASAATSPTDYLYYNSATGGLYYDLDGSGSSRPGFLVAKLDPGLSLQASNFQVV